ncbi:hypothetical protein [Alishewanella longhuensis]
MYMAFKHMHLLLVALSVLFLFIRFESYSKSLLAICTAVVLHLALRVSLQLLKIAPGNLYFGASCTSPYGSAYSCSKSLLAILSACLGTTNVKRQPSAGVLLFSALSTIFGNSLLLPLNVQHLVDTISIYRKSS